MTWREGMQAAARAYAADGDAEHLHRWLASLDGIWDGAEPEDLPEHIVGPLVRFALRSLASSKVCVAVGKAASDVRASGQETWSVEAASSETRMPIGELRTAHRAFEETMAWLDQAAGREPPEPEDR